MMTKSVSDDRITKEEESLDCGVIHESETAGTCRSTLISSYPSLPFSSLFK